MSRRRGIFSILILSLLLVGMVLFFNQPKPPPFPFVGPIEQLPDYRPPMEGVTLYPTGGPFGLDIIETITVGPSGTLFVGTFGGGLFKTTDEGRHWMPSNLGLKEKFISTLITLDEGTVFAGTVRAGLFKSEDDGAHWVSANQGLEDLEVQTMLLRVSGDILAGTGRGVYITRNKGQSWEPFNKGLSDISIQSLVETKEKTIFAGTQGRGIYKRELVEEEWVSVVAGFNFQGLIEGNIRTLVLGRQDALFAGTMASGIYRSLDGGEHWERGTAGLGSYSIRTLSIDGKGNLYAGTGEGVYFSEDDGASWFPLKEGMDDIQIHSFFANHAGDLYAGSSSGVYRGRIGLAWEALHEELLISPILALDYGVEGITVGTYGKGTYINRQDNWMSDNLGLVNLSILAMARGKTFLYAITRGGVYRRQLGRHRWEAVKGHLPGEPISIEVDLNGRLYIGSTRGLFSSSDQGRHWQKEEAIGTVPVNDMTVGPDGILVAVENAVWSKPTESGWEKIVTKEGSPFQHIFWRAKKGLLAVMENRLWERDLSGTWRELNEGLPEDVQIKSIAGDPYNSRLLYLGTDKGLFWSAKNGEEWHQARLYQGHFYEGQVNQILPTKTSAIWLATESEGVVLGFSKMARRNLFTQWLDRIS